MARRVSMSQLDLSPFVYHKRLMDEGRQLGYDGGEVKAWQRKLRRKFHELLCLQDMADRKLPLQPAVLWKRQTKLGTIEKITFRAEKGADIVAYWCVPHEALKPYPTFICVQGHSTGMHNSIAVQREDETQPNEVEGDRDFAIGAMKRGIAALCVEQRSFGDRREQVLEKITQTKCLDAALQAFQLGTSLAGQRVFDIDCAIDYLQQRGDVDMKRLGIMGNSGGGTTSINAAAALQRIRLVMPSCAFCTYRDSIMAMPHCACNYIPGIMKWAESSDIAGLIAPRPMVVVTGRFDPIFPLPGVRKAMRELKKIYAAFDAADNLKLVIGEGEHRFYADQGWSATMKMLAKV